MTYLQLTVAIVVGVTAGVWSWLAERRKIREARVEGYGSGWLACEEHARAHAAVCPEPDADEAFEAGYRWALEKALLDRGMLDALSGDVDLDVECDRERCVQRERYLVN